MATELQCIHRQVGRGAQGIYFSEKRGVGGFTSSMQKCKSDEMHQTGQTQNTTAHLQRAVFQGSKGPQQAAAAAAISDTHVQHTTGRQQRAG